MRWEQEREAVEAHVPNAETAKIPANETVTVEPAGERLGLAGEHEQSPRETALTPQ